MEHEDVLIQSATIIHISHPRPILFIEDSARKCYRSHDKVCPGSAEKMVATLLKKGHGMPFEFIDVIVDFVTNRAISHQIVRHRHASILQESQRYVRFNTGNIQFIKPVGFDPNDPGWQVWLRSCQRAADDYCEMLAYGKTPQQAREVLPSATATRLRVKANCREWMHIMSLRDAPGADPQMIDLMGGLHRDLKACLPELFGGGRVVAAA